MVSAELGHSCPQRRPCTRQLQIGKYASHRIPESKPGGRGRRSYQAACDKCTAKRNQLAFGYRCGQCAMRPGFAVVTLARIFAEFLSRREV